jgi:hypothetical protein
MSPRLLSGVALAACITSGAPLAAQAKSNDWDRIDLDGPITTLISDGQGGVTERILEPGCSEGPVVDTSVPGGIRPGKSDYYFFVQRGNPNRLLIALDGGGGCWDALTCIGSAASGNSTYTVELDETAEGLAASQGLFDADNKDNPYKNYTKVFIPYCTGDIHWGSRDTTYSLEGLPSWTIKHRGTDNVLAVLQWLRDNARAQYRVDFDRARDVTVTGLSAGGYGATLAFPYVADLAPKARLNLISDAAIGVQSQPFYEQAIYKPGDTGNEVWGVVENLPPFVPGLDEDLLNRVGTSGNPSDLTAEIFAALAAYKPDAKLAALTHDLDGVQVSFYALQTNQFGSDGRPTQQAFAEWNQQMLETTNASAANGNYRFFIREGFDHTFLANDVQTYSVMGNGISVADWISNMIKPGNRVWDSLGG